MAKPWFRCLSCDKIKLRGKKTYSVVVKGDDYQKTLYMCGPCGETLDSVYNSVNQTQDE